MKKGISNYLLIILGSMLYAIATVIFIFPHTLLLGGTSGISVILNEYLSFSPGTILVIINSSLLVVAFFILGKEMAVKTFVGSTLTTVFVGIVEKLYGNSTILIPNIFLSAIVGATLIACASATMFYVKSSSGGTDIIALIVRKYSNINIGKALLITDFLIVVTGGILLSYIILISSLIGLLIKTFGIDFIIGIIENIKKRNGKYVS